jgi:hypothetical protein
LFIPKLTGKENDCFLLRLLSQLFVSLRLNPLPAARITRQHWNIRMCFRDYTIARPGLLAARLSQIFNIRYAPLPRNYVQQRYFCQTESDFEKL